MFNRVRPIGGWGISQLDPAEMEAIDSQLVEALDGKAGGIYEPSDVLSVGGAGFEVAANFNVSGVGVFAVQSTVQAATFLCPVVLDCAGQELTIVHDAHVYGVTHLDGDVTLGGALTLSNPGSTLFVEGLASFQGIAGFDAVVSMNHQVNCADELNVGGAAGFAGIAAFASTATFNANTVFATTGTNFVDAQCPVHVHDEIVLADAGRIRYRVAVSTITGDGGGQTANFSVRDYDMVMIGGDGVLVGPIGWVIANDAQPGNLMKFSRVGDKSNHPVSIIDGTDMSILATLDGTNSFAVTMVYSPGGVWKPFEYDRKGA